MNLRENGIIKKNIKKPLDIQGVLCYNKDNAKSPLGQNTLEVVEKSATSFHLRRPSTGAEAGILIITHPTQFVNRQFAQTLAPKFSHNCATLPIDFWIAMCYNS
jgi:hypothetical protein